MATEPPSASLLTAADRGSLVLADISGYTSYLLGTELEHAQDVLSDLMHVVVSSVQPPLQVTKLEGDAVFAYALDGACGASTLLDAIERAYFAFRSRQRDIALATSCTCAACRQIPTLDLKFLVHHGSFVRRSLAGSEELTGRDVIVIHRLTKNSASEALGTKGYVLLTDASTQALALDPEALHMQAHVETYEDVGEVCSWLEDLGARWADESKRSRHYVARDGALFERSLTVQLERPVVWDWLTAPARRSEWQADRVDLVSPGGRERTGVTNHCLHGVDVVVEHVADWQPFDYFTMRYEIPGVGPMHLTTELTALDDGTVVETRGEPLTGERLQAWGEVAEHLLATVDAAQAALDARLAEVVRERSEAAAQST